MKNFNSNIPISSLILVLIATSLLLQSCYSYKTIDIKNHSLTEGTFYKINCNDFIYKGKLLNFNDSVMKIEIDNKVKQIAFDQIKKIKQKKFSFLKILGFVPIIYATINVINIFITFSRVNSIATYH